MTIISKWVSILVDTTKNRDPLNWCATCRLRQNCLTVLVNAPGHNQGPLMPSIAVAHCSTYEEELQQ